MVEEVVDGERGDGGGVERFDLAAGLGDGLAPSADADGVLVDVVFHATGDGDGVAEGDASHVFLAAMMPATRATSRASPLSAREASRSAGMLSSLVRTSRACATRRVSNLWVMSRMASVGGAVRWRPASGASAWRASARGRRRCRRR